MSKEARRGLAAIRGLFAKAADMGDAETDDDLEQGLEEDFQELDAATQQADEADAAAAEGDAPPPPAEGDEEDDLDEDEMSDFGKAHSGAPSEEVDATPILSDIATLLRGIHDQQSTVIQQNSMIAKGLLGLVDEQETVAKSVTEVRREVDESPRLPKSGRRPQPRRAAQAGAQVDLADVVAKAVTDTAHFSARDVAKLDSLAGRRDIESIYREFDPDQIQALGLPVKN